MGPLVEPLQPYFTPQNVIILWREPVVLTTTGDPFEDDTRIPKFDKSSTFFVNDPMDLGQYTEATSAKPQHVAVEPEATISVSRV
jgi:hypothetical protein